MRIGITHHALDHWRGRCRQPTPEDVGEAKRLIEQVVEAGRPVTKLEAECLSLFVNRAKTWNAPTRSDLSAERCIINDEYGVAFVFKIEANGQPVVTTCALMRLVLRQARGLPGSKLRKIEARQGVVA
jgi:hypothetical protein